MRQWSSLQGANSLQWMLNTKFEVSARFTQRRMLEKPTQTPLKDSGISVLASLMEACHLTYKSSRVILLVVACVHHCPQRATDVRSQWRDIVMLDARAASMGMRWKIVGSHRTLPAADCSERVFLPPLDAVDVDSNAASNCATMRAPKSLLTEAFAAAQTIRRHVSDERW